MNSRKPRSISRTFSAGLIITLVLAAGLSLGVNYVLSSRKAKAELETRLDEYTSAITDALKVPLWTFSEETIAAICASYAQNEFIAKLIVEGEDGAVLFEKEESDQALVVSKSKDVFYDANRVGRVHISLASGYYTAVNRLLFQSVSLTIVVMIGALLIMTGVLLRQFFKKPMSRFIEMVETYAAGDSRAFKQGTSYSEFRPLVNVLDEMGEKIASQMQSIRQLNEDLERRVEKRTEALKKLSQAVEQSPVTVVITDKNGSIEYVNPQFSAVTGYSSKEAIGQNPRVLKSGNFSESFYKNLWDTILSGKTWRGEFLNRRKNDEEFWESASISPIKNDEDEITHFVAVKQDITEKKLIEEELVKSKKAAEDANKAKSEFLANMSHEIRTPMNAVIGMAHLALKTELTTKQRDYVEKIQSSANSLLGIINDILDFSKIEAGKLDIEAVEFDLTQTLDNVANVVTVKAQEKENLEVLFYVDSRVPNFLVGDPLRLNQILVNLGNNAVKFTEHGEIVLTTKVKSKLDDTITLQFSVRDTGLGMTAAQQTRLFEAFSQADTSTTRKFGGTGLGLTISKRLVNMMGGDIWVESESGKGTTFSFTAVFGLGKKKRKKRFTPSMDLRGTKVLVVDDNATSRQILKEMLESFSFSVTVAASGPEGIAKLEKADESAPFELVVMDWKMPGMDGVEASRRIKRHPRLHSIPPIILATAYGFEEVMLQAEALGLAGFLLKPINPSTLFDTIMQAFGEAVPEGRQAAPGKSQEAKAWTNIQGARVLLVEDNEINQQVAMEILQGAGIDVTIANNGREGFEAARSNPYDAILMDIQMPVMDGYAAARKIREWESGSGKSECGSGNTEVGLQVSTEANQYPIPNTQYLTPIIAMTAHAMAGDDAKSLEAGMNDHVTKPIDPNQLFTALQKWIKPAAKRTAVQKPPLNEAAIPTDQTAPPPAGDLPESLPGFDLTVGLGRLMGNKRLYRKLLLDFGSNYGAVAGELREALTEKDFEQAHRLVHNLKGLAGNLAATELQAAAVGLEKLVKTADLKAPPDDLLDLRLEALESALRQALESAQSLAGSPEDTTDNASAEEFVDIPGELSRDIAGRIREAAEMGDVMALNAVAEDIKDQSDSCRLLSKQIHQMAEDFDLDGIQQLADELDNSKSG